MKNVLPSTLYSQSGSRHWQDRFRRIDAVFQDRFGRSAAVWCSAPGRTEIGGNHTDHNHGRVLAAAVQLDAVAAAGATSDQVVSVVSAGYDAPFVVRLDDLSPHPAESGTTTALIRGIAARMKELNYSIGGFQAVVESEVAVGSGLSSSAAFEVLIGSLFNRLWNEGKMPAAVVAMVGQHAENTFFGKPCGLMDQLASVSGGALQIDFKDPGNPDVLPVTLEPERSGYTLCVVQTGGSHSDLTADYAAIPQEMRAVAGCFGKAFCRDLKRDQLLAEAARIRKTAGDRALLRALHFVEENERVLLQAEALRSNDFERFLTLVRQSGDSSARLLQNSYPAANPREQGLSLGLALGDLLLRAAGGGACRVHGGGFAGTFQAYVPRDFFGEFASTMSGVFGTGSVVPLHVRTHGAVTIDTGEFRF